MGSISKLIEEFKNLSSRLKNRDFTDELEKMYLQNDINDIREDLKEKIEIGYERQERVKLTLRGIGFSASYKAVCRMNSDKAMKTWEDVSKFEAHMLRTYDTPNANPELIAYDTVLKGDRSPALTLEDYYFAYNLKQSGKGKYKSRLCTELVYSVSPGFFMKPGTTEFDFKIIEKWTEVTMNYLEAEFPDGQLIWAMLHVSESTPHIHCLVCGREYHEKWKKEIPSHSKFFGSREKLRNLQSNYANALQRNGFLVQRGLPNSKATHVEVSRWRSEQREKENRLKDQEEILRKKDLETLRQINKIKEEESIEKRARNKVLRDICTKYNLSPELVGKAIEQAKNNIKNEDKGAEKKIE